MSYPEGYTDILSAVGDNAYTFTVDVSADPPYVALANPVNNPNHYLESADSDYIFAQEDHITIMEIGISLPYCFKFAQVPTLPAIDFSWQVNPAGAKTGFSRLGNLAGSIWIPDHNTGLLDTYQPFVAGAAASHINYIISAATNISMVGVPSSLDGDELEVHVWMKIKHNLELTA